MRKRIEPTIVEKAIQTVDGFEKVYKQLQQQVTLKGQSRSTLENYIRRIALISLHFDRLPEQLSDDEINEYLTGLAQMPKSPLRSSFKHAVYGLRYYFRLIGQNKRAIALPSLKKDAKLPVILNRSELKELFIAPTLLKHRIVLTLIYSAGLRGQEVVNLKLSDIDFERKTIHIRQSKYKKDRIVPLSKYMAKGLKKYIAVEHPHIWLINGKEPDGRYSVRGISWAMRETLKKTSIQKEVNMHCPKCQSSKQAFWVEDLLETTLPVKHYHIVFTVPHELNTVCMLNSKWFYGQLFSAVWETLRQFGY